MLYSKELLEKSYVTTKIMEERINKWLEDYCHSLTRININKNENYMYDGNILLSSVTNKTVEMKQRQDYLIKNFVNSGCFPYETLTIPVNNFIYADILIMYDLSLDCFIISDLNYVCDCKDFRQIYRRELRNGNWCKIPYIEFPLKYCTLVDLENGCTQHIKYFV